MYCNQTTNRYLKEIAKSVGIEKKVTFHVARHTFATTVTMENGVSIESVFAQLGHASIRTTQIYAKTKKVKVENEMKLLRDKKSEIILQAEIFGYYPIGGQSMYFMQGNFTPNQTIRIWQL